MKEKEEEKESWLQGLKRDFTMAFFYRVKMPVRYHYPLAKFFFFVLVKRIREGTMSEACRAFKTMRHFRKNRLADEVLILSDGVCEIVSSIANSEWLVEAIECEGGGMVVTLDAKDERLPPSIRQNLERNSD